LSNERQRLEQEALQQLNRGSLEGALRAYVAILRLDPKDRRIRQKVGEIYLKQGKTQDAERHLREVAEALLRESSHRAAVSVLKQLVALRPDEPQLQLDLGDCYLAGSYQQDARAAFDVAMRGWVNLGKPLLAAKAAKRLAELSPADFPLRLRVAELLESGGDVTGAVASYREVMEEFRRRGRMDEVGRIAESALKSAPEDVGLLLDAAQSRVRQGEFKSALQALQTAFMSAPREPRTLDLLAQAFEGVGQPERALKVLSELAQVCADRTDYAGGADALRRALRLSPGDRQMATRLARAEDRLGRLERKLTQLQFLEPRDESTLRAVVRAEVLTRYALWDRAEAGLREALANAADPLPLQAAMAEVLIAAGRVDEALPFMERVLPHAADERAIVLDRMALLRGGGAPAESPLENCPDPAIVDDEIMDEPLTEPPGTPLPAETPEQRGDRLANAGDTAGALTAWRQALADDPLSEEVLTKIAALRTSARAREPEPAPLFGVPDDGTFAEVEPDELDDLPDEHSPIETARALVAVGQADAALEIVRELPGLAARVVEAQAHRGRNDVNSALQVMREATNAASDADPAYPEALYELAGLYTATQKHRSALRLLEELRDLAPSHRSGDVEARIRGLQMLSR
jgi:tetratricopeptide (TPR) repeat protein